MSRIKYRSGEAWQVCTKCNVFKPIANFSKDRTKVTGYRPNCKQCDKERRATKVVVAKPTTLWQRIKGWFR